MLIGVGIALIASMAIEEGKSRSIYFDLLATLTLVLFALWVHWLSWIMLTRDDGADLARCLAPEQNNYDALDKLALLVPEKLRGQMQWKSLQLKLRSAPATQSSCFMSISAVDNTWDSSGKRKQEKTPVVHNLLVPYQSYQALLARFTEWLAANQHFYFSHRDASCMGFELAPDGGVLYRRYDDGQSWFERETQFATLGEFTQWLAQQSDHILAGKSASLTNPVTHERIQNALSGQGGQGGY